MNIIVCVKTVPNPALPVEFDVNQGTFIDDEWNYILNPHGEVSLEQAISLKEKHGGTVTVVSLDTNCGDESLKKCLALGADTAIRIESGNLALNDSLTIAKVLSTVISRLSYDVILCRDQSSDRNCGEVGGMLAELLHLPVVKSITLMEINAKDNTAQVSRKLEKGARKKKQCRLPALFTADLLLNEPRYPVLPGRIKATKKEIDVSQAEPAGAKKTEKPDYLISICFLDLPQQSLPG